MACRRCGSRNLNDFPSEISVHLRGLKDLTKPPLLIFPMLTVCLDCTLTEFECPKEELGLLPTTIRAASEHKTVLK
jgi:hypothetical protein